MTNGGNYRIMVVDSRHGAYLREPDIESDILRSCGEVRLFCVDSAEEAIEELAISDAIISWHHIALRAPILARLRCCRGIVRASVGYDNIDLAAAAELKIPVCNVPDYGTEEVADHAMALILALVRKVRTLDLHCRQGGWEWRTAGRVPRLRGAALGIVGFGRIGSAVARRAAPFGMSVAFYDPYVPSGTDKAHGVVRCETLAELLERSLIVTLHVPLTAETLGIMGAREFGCMQPASILVNTSRGDVIVQDALRAALEDGLIGQAGLDVLSGEPEVPEWLRSSDRVLLTAHAAFYADAALTELRAKAARAARRLLLGEPERNIINGVPSGGFELCGALASA
jgi:phosphoglycerate dehydrogenase-like enzyme